MSAARTLTSSMPVAATRKSQVGTPACCRTSGLVPLPIEDLDVEGGEAIGDRGDVIDDDHVVARRQRPAEPEPDFSAADDDDVHAADGRRPEAAGIPRQATLESADSPRRERAGWPTPGRWCRQSDRRPPSRGVRRWRGRGRDQHGRGAGSTTPRPRPRPSPGRRGAAPAAATRRGTSARRARCRRRSSRRGRPATAPTRRRARSTSSAASRAIHGTSGTATAQGGPLAWRTIERMPNSGQPAAGEGAQHVDQDERRRPAIPDHPDGRPARRRQAGAKAAQAVEVVERRHRAARGPQPPRDPASQRRQARRRPRRAIGDRPQRQIEHQLGACRSAPRARAACPRTASRARAGSASRTGTAPAGRGARRRRRDGAPARGRARPRRGTSSPPCAATPSHSAASRSTWPRSGVPGARSAASTRRTVTPLARARRSCSRSLRLRRSVAGHSRGEQHRLQAERQRSEAGEGVERLDAEEHGAAAARPGRCREALRRGRRDVGRRQRAADRDPAIVPCRDRAARRRCRLPAASSSYHQAIDDSRPWKATASVPKRVSAARRAPAESAERCGALPSATSAVYIYCMGTHVSRGADVQAVLDGVRRIVQALRASSRWAEQHVGLSGAQLFVLQKLAETPGMSVNELAERTHTHQSSVSTVVSRLVDARAGHADAVGGRRPPRRAVAGAARRAASSAARPDVAQERLIRGDRAAAAGAAARAGRGPRRSGDGDGRPTPRRRACSSRSAAACGRTGRHA